VELAVIDYGNGNLGSLLAALRRLGQTPRVIARAEDIHIPTDAVIFPGVGSLAEVVPRLRRHGLLPWLNALHDKGTPMLGICLGMQLFFEQGDEGAGQGLGWLAGSVPVIEAPILPHIGWNTVEKTAESFLWGRIPSPPTFYFVHSYRITPSDASIVRGATEYYETFPSVIEAPPLYGVQFHPELSGHSGALLLENFLEMAETTHGTMAGSRLA
jgi:glutamine amidotransferase